MLLTCTADSDTVCAEEVNCRRNVSYQIYDWLEAAGIACHPGYYLTGYDPTNDTLACALCPDGLYGPNGLWCDVCPGYKVPYYRGAGCVCYSGTQQNAGGACECGPGMEFLTELCVPCDPGYSDWTLEIQENW